MKKNRNLATFLFIAALVQIYVIYHFYQKSVKEDHEAVVSLRSEGFDKLSDGKYQSAVAFFDKVLEIEENDTSAWMLRGLSYQGLKKYKEAGENFMHVLEIDPNKTDAFVLLGNLYFEQGDPKKALESYMKGERSDPGNPIVPIHKAAYFLKMKMPDEALTELEKIQKLKPGFEELQSYFGEAYFLKGDFPTAKIYLENALAKKSGDQKALMTLGSIQLKSGNKKEACSLFEQALKSGATSAADSLKKYCR